MHRTRPTILDAFCCQGGTGRGFDAAGFDVTGIDINPQPRYPFPFIQGDAVDYILQHGHKYDAISAGPPCQLYSKTWRIQQNEHPDLIAATREAILAVGKPGVIENVEDAVPWLIDPVMLCGTSFGLRTYRHRYFEAIGCSLTVPAHQKHVNRLTKMGRPVETGTFYHAVGNFSGVDMVRTDMKVHGMNRDGIRECIPPAYAEYLGHQLMQAIA